MKKIRKKKDVGIYGVAAKWYDRNTRKTRLAEMRGYADEIESLAKPGASILEVAPGPGYLAIELARRGFQVTAVELSPDFVCIARNNAKEANVAVDFKEGNASNLPCPDEAFDFIVCSAAFKNFKEPIKALHEMYRVLKPGGMSLIIDMNREATDEDINNQLQGTKGFDKYFVKFSFKTFLKQAAYTKNEFEALVQETPFRDYTIKTEGISIYVYLYK